MSSRSGHVDINERRLRPIYGQNTFAVKLLFHTYVLTLIRAIIIARVYSIKLHVRSFCVNHVLNLSLGSV